MDLHREIMFVHGESRFAEHADRDIEISRFHKTCFNDAIRLLNMNLYLLLGLIHANSMRFAMAGVQQAAQSDGELVEQTRA
jgi:hypothetical protein